MGEQQTTEISVKVIDALAAFAMSGVGMSAPERFGLLLRLLRDRTGLTREEIASKADVSVHTLSQWETGKVERHNREALDRLGTELRVTGQWLRDRRSEMVAASR